jgi:hypothetical protein
MLTAGRVQRPALFLGAGQGVFPVTRITWPWSPKPPEPAPWSPGIRVDLPQEVKDFMARALEAAFWDGFSRGLMFGIIVGAVVTALIIGIYHRRQQP